MRPGRIRNGVDVTGSVGNRAGLRQRRLKTRSGESHTARDIRKRFVVPRIEESCGDGVEIVLDVHGVSFVHDRPRIAWLSRVIRISLGQSRRVEAEGEEGLAGDSEADGNGFTDEIAVNGKARTGRTHTRGNVHLHDVFTREPVAELEHPVGFDRLQHRVQVIRGVEAHRQGIGFVHKTDFTPVEQPVLVDVVENRVGLYARVPVEAEFAILHTAGSENKRVGPVAARQGLGSAGGIDLEDVGSVEERAEADVAGVSGLLRLEQGSISRAQANVQTR